MDADLVDHPGIGDGLDGGSAQRGAFQIGLCDRQSGTPDVTIGAEERLPDRDAWQVSIFSQNAADVGYLGREQKFIYVDECKPAAAVSGAPDAMPVGRQLADRNRPVSQSV